MTTTMSIPEDELDGSSTAARDTPTTAYPLLRWHPGQGLRVGACLAHRPHRHHGQNRQSQHHHHHRPPHRGVHHHPQLVRTEEQGTLAWGYSIAARADLGRSKVFTVLRELEAVGAIRRVTRGRKGDAREQRLPAGWSRWSAVGVSNAPKRERFWGPNVHGFQQVSTAVDIYTCAAVDGNYLKGELDKEENSEGETDLHRADAGAYEDTENRFVSYALKRLEEVMRDHFPTQTEEQHAYRIDNVRALFEDAEPARWNLPSR